MAALWGDGDKASADMMALAAFRQLWNARVDPCRRTYAAGIYTHLRDSWGSVYAQPIVLNERQAGVAIEGVEQFNRVEDCIRLSLPCVDTHGWTNVEMGLAKLLGFDLCPHLRDLAERKLFLPHPFTIPEELESVIDRRVPLRAIERGWDELLRLAASIRTGRVSAALALQRLGPAARGDPVHRAADHLGRLLRAISGSLTLLANGVIAWNTARIEVVVERLHKSGVRIEDAWLHRMGPAYFAHINFRGVMRFGIERYAQSLIDDPSSPARQMR